MNKNSAQNTKEHGIARTIIFPFKKGYMAVCLDFDLIEEGDTREEVEENIKEAVIGYIKNVCRNNLDDKLLNRHAEKKYWKLYDSYLAMMENKVKKPAPSLRNSSLYTLPISNDCACLA